MCSTDSKLVMLILHNCISVYVKNKFAKLAMFKLKIQIKRFLLKRDFIYYRKITPCDNAFPSYVVI